MAKEAYEAGATSWTDQWDLGWEDINPKAGLIRTSLDKDWIKYLEGEYETDVATAILESAEEILDE